MGKSEAKWLTGRKAGSEREGREERGALALSLMGGAAWGEENLRVGDSGSANLGTKGGTLTFSLRAGCWVTTRC